MHSLNFQHLKLKTAREDINRVTWLETLWKKPQDNGRKFFEWLPGEFKEVMAFASAVTAPRLTDHADLQKQPQLAKEKTFILKSITSLITLIVAGHFLLKTVVCP